jgi:putative addiction module component (TIGR02574 family)
MPVNMRDFGIDRLTVEDRLALAEEIWESVAAEVERQPLTEAQRAELERRAAADANPDAGIPWEVVRAEARARWGR